MSVTWSLSSVLKMKGIDDKKSGYDDSQERRELEKQGYENI